MFITSFHSPCGVILGQYELGLYSKLLHGYVKTVITLKFVAFATRNTHREHGCLARMQTIYVTCQICRTKGWQSCYGMYNDNNKFLEIKYITISITFPPSNNLWTNWGGEGAYLQIQGSIYGLNNSKDTTVQ